MDRIDLTAYFVLFIGIPMAVFLGWVGMLFATVGIILVGGTER